MDKNKNDNKTGGSSSAPILGSDDAPYKIRLFVRGEDSGTYDFRTKAEADDHYDWNKSKFGGLGCRYSKEYPNARDEAGAE